MKFIPHAYQTYAIEYIKTHPVTDGDDLDGYSGFDV